jgi:hypothetical protein
MSTKNKSNTKVLIAILGVAIAIVGVMFVMQGVQFSPVSDTPGVEKLADGRLKKTIEVPAPSYSVKQKRVQDAVNDFLESAPDKAVAIASLETAYSLPHAEELAQLKKYEADAAKLQFEIAEWAEKEKLLQEKGLAGIEKPAEDKESVRRVMGSNNQKTPINNQYISDESLKSFVLQGIVSKSVAKLSRGSKRYSVRDGYVIDGDIKVTVSESLVTLTQGKETINLYIN